MRTHTDLGPEGTFVAWLEMMEECGNISVRATSSAISIWVDFWERTDGAIADMLFSHEPSDGCGGIFLDFRKDDIRLVSIILHNGYVGWLLARNQDLVWGVKPKRRKRPPHLPQEVYTALKVMTR